MHRTHATQDRRLSGMAHGFIEQSFHAHRPDAAGAFGSTRVAHTNLDKLAGVVLAACAWVRGEGSVAGRLRHGAVVAAGTAFVWFLDHWNLLGFRY